MIRRPPRSTHCISSAASDVYKRQIREVKNYLTKSWWLPKSAFTTFLSSWSSSFSKRLHSLRKAFITLLDFVLSSVIISFAIAFTASFLVKRSNLSSSISHTFSTLLPCIYLPLFS
eukprot:TRINITY_DN9719_c0_g1_i1.p1 TRINITY_DN9719_c0_g1~~TRINITY_DN9719_c0_g1_i1.p1  ORF type:complete len:125 (+),score=6.04 TRINITY_DN9719_c0_g1_i1:29-376(+)